MRRECGIDDGNLILLQTCQRFLNLARVFLMKLKLQYGTKLMCVGIISEYMARVGQNTELPRGRGEK